MSRTRLSLCYLAGYLSVGGLGLTLAPELALKLMMSNGQYGVVMPRVVGALMIGLAMIVVQIIRLRVAVLYSTTLAVRVFLLGVLGMLYLTAQDPFFLVISGIVALGVALTSAAWWYDWKHAPEERRSGYDRRGGVAKGG